MIKTSTELIGTHPVAGTATVLPACISPQHFSTMGRSKKKYKKEKRVPEYRPPKKNKKYVRPNHCTTDAKAMLKRVLGFATERSGILQRLCVRRCATRRFMRTQHGPYLLQGQYGIVELWVEAAKFCTSCTGQGQRKTGFDSSANGHHGWNTPAKVAASFGCVPLRFL